MKREVDYVLTAVRLVEMAEAGDISDASMKWYLRLLIEDFKRTRLTSYPPLRISNRELEALWGISARSVTRRLSEMQATGLVNRQQIGQYEWHIEFLVKHEDGSGIVNPTNLAQSDASAVSRMAVNGTNEPYVVPEKPRVRRADGVFAAAQPSQIQPSHSVATLTDAPNGSPISGGETIQPSQIQPSHSVATLPIIVVAVADEKTNDDDARVRARPPPSKSDLEFLKRKSRERVEALKACGVLYPQKIENEVQRAIDEKRIGLLDINAVSIRADFQQIGNALPATERHNAPGILVTRLRDQMHPLPLALPPAKGQPP